MKRFGFTRMIFPHKKAPNTEVQGTLTVYSFFFHPDCTVGTGFTPVQLSLADLPKDLFGSLPVGNFTLP